MCGAVVIAAAALAAPAASAASRRAAVPLTATVTASVSGIAVAPGSSTALASVTNYDDAAPYTSQAAIWKWTGTKWVDETIPSLGADSYMNGIVAPSSSEVWALGAGGPSDTSTAPVVLHETGGSWTTLSLPTADEKGSFYDLAASGSSLWLVGTLSSKLVALRYDGSWSSRSLPGSSSQFVVAVSASSPTSLWAVLGKYSSKTETDIYSVLEPTSTAWKTIAVPAGTSVGAMSARSASDVLLAGDVPTSKTSTDRTPIVDSLHGSSWAETKLPESLSSSDPSDLVQPSTTDAWVVGNEFTNRDYQILVDRLDGTKWSEVTVKVPGKTAFAGSFGAASETDAWLFGTSWSGAPCTSTGTMVAFHWTGSAFKQVSTPTPAVGAPIRPGAVSPRC